GGGAGGRRGGGSAHETPRRAVAGPHGPPVTSERLLVFAGAARAEDAISARAPAVLWPQPQRPPLAPRALGLFEQPHVEGEDFGVQAGRRAVDPITRPPAGVGVRHLLAEIARPPALDPFT